LFGTLDNRSRLGCHLQWYLGESAEELTHGFGQALQKRGKPAGIMMDNGPAMKAGETRQGLLDLGIELVEIPDYTPEHNAIIEAFWKQINLRLIPMLESVKDLTLAQINEATQAWLELEYNRSVHSETKQKALPLIVRGPSTDDLRERLLETHAKTPARTLRTPPRHLPSSARFPMGSSFAATLSEMRLQ
jgi:putative transposase